ncbi:hypothetical protein AAAC07_25735 [Pseudomonas aeruginosa]
MSAYSLQGVSLSSSERRSLQLRQQARAAVDRSVLQQTVAQALQALEKHKEEGGKASNPGSLSPTKRARRGLVMHSGGRDGD